MLSLFPELLFLSPFAAFLIRISVALLLAYAATKHITDQPLAIKGIAVIQFVTAVLILTGTYTQAAALIALLFAIISLVTPRYRIYPRSTLALGTVMAFTLLITGPGPFAFDLPL